MQQVLIGDLPEERQRVCVEHLDQCVGCQQAIQLTATGDSGLPELVEHIDQQQPAKESAYWSAVSSARNDFAQTLITPAPRPVADLKLDFLDPPSDPAYLGRLGHFDIARVIGRGGMGIVFEAFDTHLRRSVAIKVLDPQLQTNELARQRFCREARAAASITHEHVVALHHVARSDENEVPYLVMQLVHGESLESRLAREGRLPVKDVLRIGMQAAAGLAAAHAQNLVHRDIKPGNILLERSTGRVKLTDFGLVRMVEDSKLTQTGYVTGTPMYMAPEQALGEEAGARADLFSLGTVLYEAASGRAPFAAGSVLGVLKKITEETPPPIRSVCPEMPEGAALLIDQMLSKEPSDRPVSASALAEAFAVVLTQFGPLSPLEIPAVAEEAACDAVRAALSESGQTVCHRQKLLARLRYALTGVVAGVILSLIFVLPLLNSPDDSAVLNPGANGGANSSGPDESSRVPDAVPNAVLTGNAGPVWAVAFTPDAKTLAMAIDDGTVKLWDVASKRVLSTIKAHAGPVWGLSISPDGQWLATGGDDGTVRIFDLTTAEQIKTLEAGFGIRTLVFSRTARELLIGGRTGQVEVWNADSGEKRLATAGHAGTVVGVAFSPDGRTLASVSGDKTAKLWNAGNGSEQLVLEGHTGGIYGVAFSPDGSQIVTSGWDRTVRLWDTASGSLQHTCEGHAGDVWGVAFSPSTPFAASVGEDRIVRVWQTEQKEEVAALAAHTGTLYSVTFSQDGRWLASAGRDGTARVWDMQAIAAQPALKK